MVHNSAVPCRYFRLHTMDPVLVSVSYTGREFYVDNLHTGANMQRIPLRSGNLTRHGARGRFS